LGSERPEGVGRKGKGGRKGKVVRRGKERDIV
jgi:hypothetical protein